MLLNHFLEGVNILKKYYVEEGDHSHFLGEGEVVIFNATDNPVSAPDVHTLEALGFKMREDNSWEVLL